MEVDQFVFLVGGLGQSCVDIKFLFEFTRRLPLFVGVLLDCDACVDIHFP